VNSQLKINIDPDTEAKTLDNLTYENTYENNSLIVISTAKLYVYDGEDLVASETSIGSNLQYQDSQMPQKPIIEHIG
jgi:hypothetical protein